MKKQLTSVQLDSLNPSERKIYDSIMRSFPATDPESALNVAYEGGVKFNYKPN